MNIEELRRLHADSTSGEWHRGGMAYHGDKKTTSLWGPRVKPEHQSGTWIAKDLSIPDADFCSAAHNELPELLDKIEETAKENDKLRTLLATSGADCAYCGLPAAEMAKCADGFPGCARADDLMCGPSAPTRGELLDRLERYERALREARRLHQEWAKATGQIDSAAYRVLCDALE